MMGVFKLVTMSLRCLKQENELYLAYIFGQILDETDFLKKRKSGYSGLILRTLVFFRTLCMSFKWHSPALTQTDVLVFAGTDNQFNSLVSVVEGMSELNVRNSVLITKDLSYKNKDSFVNATEITFSPAVVAAALILFSIRFWPLYRGLRKQRRFIEINQYFNNFCEAFVFLPYFVTQLNSSRPKMIVVSNDHNTPNRCFRLMAEVYGIKTLYVQHASVSDLFPPLEFDYAFLDGEVALSAYAKCHFRNVPPPVAIRNVANCVIVLSGQKKPVAGTLRLNSTGGTCVGIGVNNLDDFDYLIDIIKKLVAEQMTVLVRTHPGQSPEFIKKLQNFIFNNDSVKWSNAREHNLNYFFSEIDYLIAGNTGLHLEAALAGLSTFYLEMSNVVEFPDYYGFVKNGLSLYLEKNFSACQLTKPVSAADRIRRIQSIRMYSETYQTTWQSKEGALSALLILNILTEISFTIFLKSETSDMYKEIYRI